MHAVLHVIHIESISLTGRDVMLLFLPTCYTFSPPSPLLLGVSVLDGIVDSAGLRHSHTCDKRPIATAYFPGLESEVDFRVAIG